MSFSILVCETDKAARDFLKIKVETVIDNTLTFLYTTPDIESVVGHVFVHQPNIVYIDLKYARECDLNVYEKLLQTATIKPKIVVAVADAQLELLQRFVELGINSFLMKPLKNEAVKKTFHAIIKQLMDEGDYIDAREQSISLRSNRTDIQINQKDILIIESSRNICYLTLKDGSTRTVNESIGSIEKKLVLKQLVKMDKSTIINTDKIVFLENDRFNKSCKLKLVNGELVTKIISKAGMIRMAKVKKNHKLKGQNIV